MSSASTSTNKGSMSRQPHPYVEPTSIMIRSEFQK